MEDLENIFANIKINSDDSSEIESEKLFSEIDIALKKNETTSKWMDELDDEFGALTTDDIDNVFDLIEEKVANDRSRTSEDDTKALRYSIVETIAKQCLRVEFKIRRNEFEPTDVTAIVQLINDHKAYYTEKDHMVGFRYVANCLAIKGHLKEMRSAKKVNIFALKGLLTSLNEYQTFSTPQRCGVLAIKQYFGGNLRNSSYDFQLKIIRELVKMEPENLEWQYCLYSVLRYQRGANKAYKDAPSKDEIEVITKANDQRYAIFDARICLGYAFCLAELLKSAGKVMSPITFGNKIFYREDEVIRCIRAKVDDLLAIDPTSVRSNVDVAKIYSTILPPTHRDTSFAMACVKRALLFHPNSSKANHRMAMLLIATNSPTEAVEYLQKAIKADYRNIFATVDLLKIFMSNTSSYKSEMEEIFANSILKAQPNYGEILVLKAVYTYLNGNSGEAVDFLFEAATNITSFANSMQRLNNNFKRGKWGDYNSFCKDMKRILVVRMTSCGSAEKATLNKIWESLKESHEYGNKREQFKPGRGKYDYEDFFKRSHPGGSSNSSGFKGSGGSWWGTGGSSYDSGYKSGHYGSRSGSSGHESGYKSDDGSKASFATALDDYAVLGLSKTATASDIKKQYHKSALEHHPDKNMGLSEEELHKKQEWMKRINTAYTNLMAKF